ncbi:hypothetical protein J6590_040008 [Homalodisca vitripennis]|nr:hypothetical protein J6590_040008 [Homalodisca vitripennis]
MDDFLWGFAGLEGLFESVAASVTQDTEGEVTEMVVSGTTSGGVVRVQRGWSEESGYRSHPESVAGHPTSSSEASEVSLTELGNIIINSDSVVGTPSRILGTDEDLSKFLRGAADQESGAGEKLEVSEEEEDEMVLVPSVAEPYTDMIQEAETAAGLGYRTVAHEYLPSQEGVHFVNKLPDLT